MATLLQRAAQRAAVVVLEGPRGAGKTHLVRSEFPRRVYVSLEEAGARRAARGDPAGFLRRLRGPAVVDEVERAPELVGYLAAGGGLDVVAVSSRKLGLAVETLRLYGPTRAELERRAAVGLEMLGRFVPAPVAGRRVEGWRAGFGERDVEGMVRVRDLDRFALFVEAARRVSGRVLDVAALAGEAGVSRTTGVRWLAVLEALFETVTVEASEDDFGRRVVRSAKLHFVEGGGFESGVVSELWRNAWHGGERPAMRHWRDSNGFGVELVVAGRGGAVMPVVIGEEAGPVEVGRLRRWMALAGVERGAVVAGRAGEARRGGVAWYGAGQL